VLSSLLQALIPSMIPSMPRGARLGPIRVLRRHRRGLAALLLAAAAAVAVHSLSPAPAGVLVLVAAHDLPAGHELAASDLRQVPLPPGAVPAGVLDQRALEGARLASGVRAGEPITDARVSGASLLSTLPSGQVAVPVRLQPGAAQWVQVGQRVSLLAAPVDPLDGRAAATVAADDVVVLDLAGGSVAAPWQAGAEEGTAVLVSTDREGARRIVGASSGQWLTAVLVP